MINDDDDDEPDKISTNHLGIFLVGFCLLEFIPHTMKMKMKMKMMLFFAKNNAVLCTTCSSAVLHLRLIYIIHPFQQATRAREATDPGYSLRFAYDNKMRGTADLCHQQGIEFVPIVANSVGGWHKEALTQFHKLGSALSRNTGTEESVCIGQIITRSSLLLQKGLSALILNRSPNLPPAAISGSM